MVIQPDNYCFLQDLIQRQSGIVLDDTKVYLMEARLLPVAQEAELRNLDELCDKLRHSTNTSLRRRVIEAITTNETYFFREPEQFRVLADGVLPSLAAGRGESRKLSFWSAAASTGQEAYSLAILLWEAGFQNWDVSILGTDLSATVVARAREGRYTQLEVTRGLSASMLTKYFTRQNGTWLPKAALRDMVRFQELDLRDVSSSFGPFDVVLCRNVLIYFDLKTRLRVVNEIRATLNPNGLLFVGASELGIPLGSHFRRISSNQVTYYQAI